MKKYYIIVNTLASVGSGQKKWQRIQSFFEDKNIEYDYDLTESKNHASILAIKAIRNGCKNIIVAGGDGTANEVVNGIMIQNHVNPSEINLGIIPIGTGNDWCRTLEVSAKVDKAIDLILSGKTLKHDVGLVEYAQYGRRKKRYFINIAGMGFDSMVLKKTNEIKERKRLAREFSDKKKKGEGTYIQTLLKTLLFYKPGKMNITIDNNKVSKAVFSMAVGIGRFNGNGMEQLPLAKVNDGLFDINIIHAVSKVRILKNLTALYNGNIHEKKIVDMFQAKKVSIETEDYTLVETDGELLGESPFEFNILPKAINVFCRKI